MVGDVPIKITVPQRILQGIIHHRAAGIEVIGARRVKIHLMPEVVQRHINAVVGIVLFRANPSKAHGLGIFLGVIRHGHIAGIAPYILAVHLVGNNKAAHTPIFGILTRIAFC